MHNGHFTQTDRPLIWVIFGIFGAKFGICSKSTESDGSLRWQRPRGKFLSEEDCRRRLAQIFKKEEDLDDHWLEPLKPRQILVRLLDNLKHIYIHRGDFQRALTEF